MRVFYKDIPVDHLVDKYSDEQSRFVSCRGMRVHYQDEGKGPTLLMVHGTGASLHTWDDWTRRLIDQYRVIRLDMPGFGLTGPHPERNYDMDTYCTFLDEFRAHLGLETFDLVGNSLGGRIAWNYALRFPDHVQKLVLIAASGYPMDIKLLVFRLARIPGAKKFLKRAAPFGGVYLNLKQCFEDGSLVTGRMVKRYHQLLLREGNRQALLDRIGQEFSNEYRDIPKIKARTLILWGDRDRVVPPDLAFRFKDDIRDSRLIMYENIGHIPMEEIPDRSVQDLCDFLES